uniref:Uncharacterized protein n=1 Tax=Tanacetum cinerariifolium TaxID=118510 RepID=A0A6L2NDE4_TANCI|nr:hypothetical protein [Tanacetum cinerariifolium]
MYLFPEVEEKLDSLMGYRYKCVEKRERGGISGGDCYQKMEEGKFLRTHEVKVITNGSIEQIIRNPGTTRRLAIWIVGLRTYHISYVSKATEEGHMVMEFLVKEKEESRFLEEDVGLVLPDPEEKEYSYALRLNFQGSKNDMEYEALLTRLAVEIIRQVKDIYNFVDLNLMVNKVEGYGEAKKGKAKRYQEEVMNATTPFHRF